MVRIDLNEIPKQTFKKTIIKIKININSARGNNVNKKIEQQTSM
jgi:hypothetical protein